MNDTERKIFPAEHYDEAYYQGMAKGGWEWFLNSKGRVLTRYRLRDLGLCRTRSGMRLLDVGCGRGELVLYGGGLLGMDAYGLDYSPAAIQLGLKCVDFYQQAARERIHLAQADMTSLPFPKEFFDRIMSWSTFEHLYPWQLERCVQEMHRVLRPDGLVVVATDPSDWYEKYGYRILRPIKQLLLGKRLPTYEEMRENEPEHVSPCNPIFLRDLFKEQGFHVRVDLMPRDGYELEGRLARFAGRALESIPVIRNIFCTRIVVYAAKEKKILRRTLALSATAPEPSRPG